jgi:hypothetical protein
MGKNGIFILMYIPQLSYDLHKLVKVIADIFSGVKFSIMYSVVRMDVIVHPLVEKKSSIQ